MVGKRGNAEEISQIHKTSIKTKSNIYGEIKYKKNMDLIFGRGRL
jgi:hypothetical protein